MHHYINVLCVETNNSRVFKDFPPELMKDMESEPLTEHFHKWSVSTEVSPSLS